MLKTNTFISNFFSAVSLKFTLVVICGFVLIQDCNSQTEPKHQPDSFLRIGITPNYPPIVFEKRGQFAGVEIDLANQLAKYLGLKPLFVKLVWEDQIKTLMDGETDIIMSGMSKTDERALLISFSTPYFRLGQLPLIRREDLYRYKTWRSIFLMTGRVGVEKATTGDIFVTKELKNADKIQFISIMDGMTALLRGQIEMLIYDAPFVHWVAKEHQSGDLAALAFSPLSEEFLAWGVRKSNRTLLNKVNEFIRTSEKNGTIDEIISGWISK